MAVPVDPYTFADGPGNVASGVQVNQRFTPIYNALNPAVVGLDYQNVQNNGLREINMATGANGLAKGLVSAFLNASQTGVVTSTFTKVAFNAEDFDVSGWFDTALSRYTPQVAGYYRFTTRVLFLINPSTNTRTQLLLYKNGAQLADLDDATMQSVDESRHGSFVAVANGTTDYFEIFAWHNAGSNKSLYGDNTAKRATYLQTELIGRS